MKSFRIFVFCVLNLIVISNFAMEEKLDVKPVARSEVAEKKFELFKDLAPELRQYIISIYLAGEFAQERDIENLIKNLFKLRSQFKEINDVIVQKYFWSNIFENFFYNLLHVNTKVSEVNDQIAKSERLIYNGFERYKKMCFHDGKVLSESQFCLNLVIPPLASVIHRINETRMCRDMEQLEICQKKYIDHDMESWAVIGPEGEYITDCNSNNYVRGHNDLEIKKFIDQIKAKTGKLWHPKLILELTTAVKGNESSFKTLIDAGANIDVQDSNGETPLMGAIRRDEKKIEILLDAGANLDIVNNEGKTAFDIVLGYINDNNERLTERGRKLAQEILDRLKEAEAKNK